MILAEILDRPLGQKFTLDLADTFAPASLHVTHIVSNVAVRFTGRPINLYPISQLTFRDTRARNGYGLRAERLP